jgi:hypothetical protein
MPVYPITNKRTGKTYDMPWDSEDPPSQMDVAKFIDRQDNPTALQSIGDTAGKAWDWMNKPLTNVVSKATKRDADVLDQPTLDEPARIPFTGGATWKGLGAGMMEGVGKVADSFTSPLQLATLGGGMAARAPGVVATVGRTAANVANAALATHGAYKVGKGAYEGNLGDVGSGGLDLLMGGTGLAHGVRATPDIAAKPFGPELNPNPEIGIATTERGFTNPGFKGGRPVIDADFTDVTPQPPKQLPGGRINYAGPEGTSTSLPTRKLPITPTRRALPPASDIPEITAPPTETPAVPPARLGLPPKSRTFFGGAAGTVSDDINAVPTRTFQGVPAVDRRIMFKGRVKPVTETSPATLQEVTNPLVDIQEQNSPYGRIMRGGPAPDTGSVVEPVMEAPKVIPDVGPEITPPEPPESPTPARKFTKPAGKAKTFARGAKKFAKGMTNQKGQIGNLGPSEAFPPEEDPNLTDPRNQSTAAPLETAPVDPTKTFETKTPLRSFIDRMKTDQGGWVKAGKSPQDQRLFDTNKLKAKDWATQRDAAIHHGNFAAEDFADLKNPDFLDAFVNGDRSGRLKDVQAHLENLYKEEVAAGVVNPKLTSPKKYTLEAATPELGEYDKPVDTIPDMLNAATRQSKVRIANERFDSYLGGTAQKDANMTVKEPGGLRFNGPGAAQLKRYVGNVTQDSPKWLKDSAQFASKLKNLYLAGGIPGTPLNIHGYNIWRSRYMASGGMKGMSDFAKGVFNPGADIAYLKSERPLIQKAIDYGYGMQGENTNPDILQRLLKKVPVVGKWGAKGLDLGEKIYEDPLFKVSLPANKARVLRENYDRLLPKVGEEQALRQASEIANDFMGGINKSLRNKTAKDLLQIGLLAPDWAESRVKLAAKGYRDIATGKLTSPYATGLRRGAQIGIAGAAIQKAVGTKTGDKASDLTTIGLGETPKGTGGLMGSAPAKYREFPIFGTAVEGLRIPLEAGYGLSHGDVKPVTQILRNRLGQPVQTFNNVFIRNEDAFGNPLSGQDKYGRQISAGQAARNYANELAAPFLPQQLQSIVGLASGKQNLEEAVSQGAEFPVKYSTPPKPPPARRSRRRSGR